MFMNIFFTYLLYDIGLCHVPKTFTTLYNHNTIIINYDWYVEYIQHWDFNDKELCRRIRRITGADYFVFNSNLDDIYSWDDEKRNYIL